MGKKTSSGNAPNVCGVIANSPYVKKGFAVESISHQPDPRLARNGIRQHKTAKTSVWKEGERKGWCPRGRLPVRIKL